MFILKLVLSTLAVSSAMSQRNIGLTGPEFRDLQLGQNPELLEFAAMTGESVLLIVDAPEVLGVVQESVNLYMNCLPWLEQFPGATLRWWYQPYDHNFMPTHVNVSMELLPGDSGRRTIGGESNEWLNITRTIAIPGAEDADTGIYSCEACLFLGDPVREECHRANVTLQVIGGPPFIDKALLVDEVIGPLLSTSEVEYKVGTDVCIPGNFDGSLIITCSILNLYKPLNVSQSFPIPDRAWFFDGTTPDVTDELLYRESVDGIPHILENVDFFMRSKGRMLLLSGVVRPSALLTVNSGGGIRFNFQVMNASAIETLQGGQFEMERQRIRREVIEAILGTWRCEVNNTFGSDSASSTFRLCETAPNLTGCQGGEHQILFPEPESGVSAGCTVCILQRTPITLDCTGASDFPVSYEWYDSNGQLVSSTAMLNTTVADVYTCNATSMDDPTESLKTVLSYRDPVRYTSEVMEQSTSKPRRDNGCSRLNNRTGLENADVCVFVGETLDLTCVTDDASETALEITTPNGSSVNGTLRVENMGTRDEGRYVCRLSSVSGTCGQARYNMDVRVFVSSQCFSENFLSYIWPNTEVGSVASAPCPCAEILGGFAGKATRHCMKTPQGAVWSTEVVSTNCETILSPVSRQLCDIALGVSGDEAVQVAEQIVNITSTSALTSSQVTVVAAVLEKLTNEAAINSEVRDNYLETIDNIQQSDFNVLQKSQMTTNSSSRILASLESFLDKLDLNTVNQTSGSNRTVLNLNTFALQVQEISPDTFKGQTFTIALGPVEQARNVSNVIEQKALITEDGEVDNINEQENISTEATATLQLQPMLFNNCTNSETNTSTTFAFRQRLSYLVFLTDSLFFPTNSTLNRVGSILVGVRSNCQLENETLFSMPIQSSFQIIETNETVQSWCAVYRSGFGAWDPKGCREVTRTNGRIACECTQLGHFGILLDLNPSALPKDLSIAVSAITFVGLALSLISLAVFIPTILMSKILRDNPHNLILVNMSVSLIGLYITFLLGGFPTKIPPLCGVISALLHYFFLTFFAWTVVETVWLYIKLVMVMSSQSLTSRYTLKAGLPAWILPSVIVAICVGAGHKYYTSAYYCRPTELPFFIGLVFPFLVIQVFNWIMFVVIMTSICKHMRSKRMVSTSPVGVLTLHDLRKTFLVTMSLGVVLGLSWGLGLVATSSHLVEITFTFQVIFSIFVGSQGVLILVFHGLKNEDFRNFWKKHPHKQGSKFVISSSFEKSNTAKSATLEEHSIGLSTLPRK